MSIILQEVGGDPAWYFAVDPVAQEWFLYRMNARDELFYWVEPRPYSTIAPGLLRSIQTRVTDGVPTLLINGKDVVAPYGIGMPEMPDSIVVGFSVGINPGSLTGHGDTFTVSFEAVELSEFSLRR